MEEGDRFYQCYYGRKKILRVTKKIRYSLNSMVHSPWFTTFKLTRALAYLSGLIGNLKTCSPDIFTFYSYLKDCAVHVPLSWEEKKIAAGEIELPPSKLAQFMQCQDVCQLSLMNTLVLQQEKAAVSGILSCGHYLFIVIFRNLETKKNLRSCWPSGSSPLINHLKR